MPDPIQPLFDLVLKKIPIALRPLAERHGRQFHDHLAHLPNTGIETWLPLLPRVFAASDFVAHTCVRHPEVLGDLIESGDLSRLYTTGEIARNVERAIALAADEPELKARLRALRRREMLRIAFRDLAGWATLEEVLAALSELADACIHGAAGQLLAWAKERHGVPRAESGGLEAAFVVLGLGKLGGRELNFSSDVDLVFAYTANGQCDGSRALSNQEFFVRLSQSLINVLSEPTGDGFVFRVDARLRPFGASGPLALSFDAMEQYYQVHGREWERYALIKARACAGDRAAGDELLKHLRPFVYRRYLDYNALDAIRDMKRMIVREVARKGMQENIKLGPGGIREIEFIVQALQLVRGGREPALQEPRLLTVLPALAARGHLESAAAGELAAAYRFLRVTENRLQMIADNQTQTLPHDTTERARLAFAVGYETAETFEHELARVRAIVERHFAQMFEAAIPDTHTERSDALATAWLDTADPEAARAALRQAGFEKPEAVLPLLAALREGVAYRAFSAEGRGRMDRLVPLLLAAAGNSPEPLATLTRLTNLLEAIGRRSTYFTFLIENPMALAQLVKLFEASPWIFNWIAQHPILLDELLDPRSLYEPLARAGLADELRQRLAHIPAEDLELQMEILREFRHGHVLRVAAADIGPGLVPERVGAQLAWIAECVIAEALDLAERALGVRHGTPRCGEARAGFAVIGYGKLGSLELGYNSDLDIIFVYEGCADGATDGARNLPNEVYFARLGQRLIHILSTRTPGGILYEVDMRLRPSGKAGPLVTSLAAFRKYQNGHAWTWEHQALVRARPVAGDAALGAAFEHARHEVLTRSRDPEKLRTDIRDMRARMVAAYSSNGDAQFDVKHAPGGLVDIEFMVQYWVLRWAHEHPDIAQPTDNIKILETLAGRGLLPAERAELLVRAYRRYLSTEHRLKLMERGSTVDPASLDGLPEAVREIWRALFEQH